MEEVAFEKTGTLKYFSHVSICFHKIIITLTPAFLKRNVLCYNFSLGSCLTVITVSDSAEVISFQSPPTNVSCLEHKLFT